MTYDNIKSPDTRDHPLSRRCIFGKTKGGVKLIPPAFQGLILGTPLDPQVAGMEQASFLFKNVVLDYVLHQHHLKTLHFFYRIMLFITAFF